MNTFEGSKVNVVLRLVKGMTGDSDTQLSILAVALVTACRSCGVTKEMAMPIIGAAFDDQRSLVLLDEQKECPWCKTVHAVGACGRMISGGQLD